jgi:hypothetical protein
VESGQFHRDSSFVILLRLKLMLVNETSYASCSIGKLIALLVFHFQAGSFLDLVFVPEDGGDVFPRNVD